MQRNLLLQPLSREHHSALKLAKICERAAMSANDAEISAACQRAVQACTGELSAHFMQEEQTLLPLLEGTPGQPLSKRTLDEHRALMAMLGDLQRNDAATLDRFGKYLTAHVRFEERELFPELERRL